MDVVSEITGDATWQRAMEFVRRASAEFGTARQGPVPTPMMTADGDGGVDVVWRIDGRSLYLNVPNEPQNVVTFCGRDYDTRELILRGETDGKGDGGWLLEWLAAG